jgi:putative Holliday junction resolvase
MIYESKGEFLKQVSKIKNFKVLGVDVGEKKSGLAIYTSEVRLAMPLMVFKDITENLDDVVKIIRNNKINAIVVGFPAQVDKNVTENAKYVMKITKLLEVMVNIPIIMSDERFTTALANTLLKEANVKRKKRNEIDDVVAACIILENFFKYAKS